MAVNKIDLNKMPPRPRSVINDTTLPKALKAPLNERVGSALGRFVKPAVPYLKTPFKVLGLPAAALAATGTTLFSDRDKAPEDRTFPKAGAAVDKTDRLALEAHKEEGALSAIGTQLGGVPRLAGGLATDIYDRTSSALKAVFSDDYSFGEHNLGPGIELTPGATEGIRTGIPYKPPVEPVETPAATTPAKAPTSKFEQLLLDQLGDQGQSAAAGPAAALEPVNDSYFINNQTGEAPGEKQYFRDLPGTTLNNPKLPQRLPQQAGQVEGQSPAYESPLVAAMENLKLPDPNTTPANYGDLLRRNFQTTSQITKLLPALAQTKELAEQRRRSETDQQAGAARRSGDLSLIARLRGQDLNANTRKAIAGAKGSPKTLSYADQLEEQTALTELSLQQFSTAPSGFAEAVPSLVQQGASLEQVQEAFNRISAIQAAAFKTSVDELDLQKLYNAISDDLGLGR